MPIAMAYFGNTMENKMEETTKLIPASEALANMKRNNRKKRENILNNFEKYNKALIERRVNERATGEQYLSWDKYIEIRLEKENGADFIIEKKWFTYIRNSIFCLKAQLEDAGYKVKVRKPPASYYREMRKYRRLVFYVKPKKG